MTAYSSLVPESVLLQRTAVIRVVKTMPKDMGMTLDCQFSLIESASWTLEELERTRQLLSEVAPALVRRFE